ncbi:unnamed protein product, partial [Schistosoma curassoni]|uniref:Uncharacterized protein n=1 Tax=Schistosoma curassoni TaxID=6186 RepID=A0A183JGA9_9TREM
MTCHCFTINKASCCTFHNFKCQISTFHTLRKEKY